MTQQAENNNELFETALKDALVEKGFVDCDISVISNFINNIRCNLLDKCNVQIDGCKFYYDEIEVYFRYYLHINENPDYIKETFNDIVKEEKEKFKKQGIDYCEIIKMSIDRIIVFDMFVIKDKRTKKRVSDEYLMERYGKYLENFEGQCRKINFGVRDNDEIFMYVGDDEDSKNGKCMYIDLYQDDIDNFIISRPHLEDEIANIPNTYKISNMKEFDKLSKKYFSTIKKEKKESNIAFSFELNRKYFQVSLQGREFYRDECDVFFEDFVFAYKIDELYDNLSLLKQLLPKRNNNGK